MKTVALIALLSIFSSPLLAKDKNVIVTTDKFTGQSTVTMKSFGIGPTFGFPDATQGSLLGVMLSLAAAARADDASSVALIVFVTAAHWQFLNGTEVHVLVDGQPIDLGNFVPAASHVDTTGAVTTNETVIGRVDRATFDRLAKATNLDIEVGNYGTKVNPKNINRLKEFDAALPAAK